MAEFDNIKVSEGNFCLGPVAGTYCSIVTTEIEPFMYIKNNVGLLLASYSFDQNDVIRFNLDAIKSLIYVGPNDFSELKEGLVFYILESFEAVDCFNCGTELAVDSAELTTCPVCGENNNKEIPSYYRNTISKWETDSPDSHRLLLENLTIKRSDSGTFFNCTTMSIENKKIFFDDDVSIGTGVIEVTDTDDIQKYDVLMLGPSSDSTNLGEFEYVYVHAISGNDIEIRTYGPETPTIYEYVEGDKITIIKDVFLFSEPEQDMSNLQEVGDYLDNRGILYRLDQYNYYTVIDTKKNGIYRGVQSAAWNNTYNALSFVKGSNLLTLDVVTYYLIKSQFINNIESDKVALIEVSDLIIDGNDIFKLQKKVTKKIDGSVSDLTTTYEWDNFNYVGDSIIPYSNNISIHISPKYVLTSQNTIQITVTLRDQFGSTLFGKNVWFSEEGGDGIGGEGLSSTHEVTDINGQATVYYQSSYDFNGMITLTVKADGSSISATGSNYVWCKAYLPTYCTYTYDNNILFQIGDILGEVFLWQKASYISNQGSKIFQFSKFSFPGGNWIPSTVPEEQEDSQPVNDTAIIYQMEYPTMFSERRPITTGLPASITYINQGFPKDMSELSILQILKESCELYLDQNIVSRHLDDNNNKDSIEIEQFVFITEAVPKPWSEKNAVTTDIWIRLRPIAESLNISTFIFKIKEVSYAGDTGWYSIKEDGIINTFDAGGGLYGIEFNWSNPDKFHHNATIYVHIEAYDDAPIPNKIVFDYWFRIIQDYVLPYIDNEKPNREDYDVPIDTKIEFDVLDDGEGVDINTLEVFLDSVQVYDFNSTKIENGYYVLCTPDKAFNYSDIVEVSVYVKDMSNNVLNDSWRFFCINSTPPWFNRDNYKPGLCRLGIDRTFNDISLQVYGLGGGVDVDSIEVHIGGKRRNIQIIPIVYRSS